MTEAKMRHRNRNHVAMAQALAEREGISYEQALREVAASMPASERTPPRPAPDRERLNVREFDDAALADAFVAADIGSPQYGAIRGELNRRLRAGNGAELDNLEGAGGGNFAVEPELTPIGARVPGPVEYGSGRSKPGDPIYSEDEAAAYTQRQPAGNQAQRAAAQLRGGGPYRGGDFLPSQQDEDMYRRGMVYTVDPMTGAGGYSVAYPQLPEMGEPGAAGRLGARADLRGPVRDTATGDFIPGTHKYDKTTVDSPLGQVEVYRPTNEFRRELAEREDRLRIERLGKRAGLSNDAILSLTSGESPADLDKLRTLGNLRRADDLAARRAEVVRRAQERSNPTALMDDEWRQFALAVRLLGPQAAGASPSDVALAREQALALQESRRSLGQGFQQPTEGQERLANARADQAEREANPEAAGIADIQQGVYESQPARTLLATLGGQYDDVWLGGADRSRKPELVDRLTKPPYNLPPEQASQAADFALRQTDLW